jgi:FAS-associated factor 2
MEQKLADKLKRKQALIKNMPSEPQDVDPKNVAKVSIRLPSGERVIRKFAAQDKVEALYEYVETLNLEPISNTADFVLINAYPRKVLDRVMTFSDAQMVPTSSCLVEEAFD